MVIMFLIKGPQKQTYNDRIPQNKGIKQDSDPGVSPGIGGRKPVSSESCAGISYSTYFKALKNKQYEY